MLIDRIYEAAFTPELWPAVLDELTDIGDAYATFLFAATRQGATWITSTHGGAFVTAWQNRSTPDRPIPNGRATRLIGARHAGFLTDLDVFTREEIDREPVYTKFLHPMGFGWGAATAIHMPQGGPLVLSLERRLHLGPVDPAILPRLNALRPHLARSLLLSSRLAFERAHAAVTALDAVGLPAAVLGHDKRLLVANRRLEALTPDVVMDRRRRAALADRNADALLAEALERLDRPGDHAAVRSMPIPASESRPPMILHVLPLCLSARDIFHSASAILVVTPVGHGEAPPAEVLQGLFDLTPAEARIARGVAERQTVEGMAASFNVSKQTVRDQLKAVFAKTGVARQTDLAALLLGGTLPAGGEQDARAGGSL